MSRALQPHRCTNPRIDVRYQPSRLRSYICVCIVYVCIFVHEKTMTTLTKVSLCFAPKIVILFVLFVCFFFCWGGRPHTSVLLTKACVTYSNTWYVCLYKIIIMYDEPWAALGRRIHEQNSHYTARPRARIRSRFISELHRRPTIIKYLCSDRRGAWEAWQPLYSRFERPTMSSSW